MKYSIIIPIILTFTIIISAFLIADRNDAEILYINVTLERPEDNDPAKIISRVEGAISSAKRMEITEETPMYAPGITVMVIQDMEEKTFWNSVSIPKKGSIYGTYSLVLKPVSSIDKTRPVNILARVVDPSGKEISVKKTETMLLLPRDN